MNKTRNQGPKLYPSLQVASLRCHGHRGLPVAAVHIVDAVGGELPDKILHHFRVAILKVKNPSYSTLLIKLHRQIQYLRGFHFHCIFPSLRKAHLSVKDKCISRASEQTLKWSPAIVFFSIISMNYVNTACCMFYDWPGHSSPVSPICCDSLLISHY